MCQVSGVTCQMSYVTSNSQTVRARDLKFWEKVHLLPLVTCHMSLATCHMLHVTCHEYFFSFFLFIVLGNKICPYELIFGPNVEKNNFIIHFFLILVILTFDKSRKLGFRFGYYNCHCIQYYKWIWHAARDVRCSLPSDFISNSAMFRLPPALMVKWEYCKGPLGRVKFLYCPNIKDKHLQRWLLAN